MALPRLKTGHNPSVDSLKDHLNYDRLEPSRLSISAIFNVNSALVRSRSALFRSIRASRLASLASSGATRLLKSLAGF